MNVITSFTSDDFGFVTRPATRNLKNFVVMRGKIQRRGGGRIMFASSAAGQLNAEAASSRRILCLFEEKETMFTQIFLSQCPSFNFGLQSAIFNLKI